MKLLMFHQQTKLLEWNFSNYQHHNFPCIQKLFRIVPRIGDKYYLIVFNWKTCVNWMCIIVLFEILLHFTSTLFDLRSLKIFLRNTIKVQEEFYIILRVSSSFAFSNSTSTPQKNLRKCDSSQKKYTNLCCCCTTFNLPSKPLETRVVCVIKNDSWIQ